METLQEIFCFTINKQRYGVPLFSVDRFLQSVTVISVPNSPPQIHGMIDYYGELIPVVNIRHRLKLPAKPISVNDYFLVVSTTERRLAIVIDEVEDVICYSPMEVIKASSLDPGMENLGFLRREDGVVFIIYELESFISSEEHELLHEITAKAS